MLSLAVQFLLPLTLAFTAFCSPLPLGERAIVIDDVSDLQTQYDYIVIGGGTSGLTVANRLTENPKSRFIDIELRHGWFYLFFRTRAATVLVIEYGPVYNPASPT